MEINLTWDLVIISFLVLLFAYSFLLGQTGTLKLIISTYVAILASDGVSSILIKFVYEKLPGLQSLLENSEDLVFIIIRLSLFIITILVFVIRGGFTVHIDKHNHWLSQTAIHALFSIFSATLLMSTILIYLSGYSFIEGILFASEINIYKDSFFAKILIDYYQIWFSVPAIGFLITSIIFPIKK